MTKLLVRYNGSINHLGNRIKEQDRPSEQVFDCTSFELSKDKKTLFMQHLSGQKDVVYGVTHCEVIS